VIGFSGAMIEHKTFYRTIQKGKPEDIVLALAYKTHFLPFFIHHIVQLPLLATNKSF
jgi:hypothetical protein